MAIADRIDERLQAKGWSQAELARRVGVKPTSIWKLAAGHSQGSKHLHAIARELETTAEYLLGESDDPSPATVLVPMLGVANEGLDPDVVEISEIDIRYGLGATYLDGPVTTEMRSFSRAWLRHFTRAAPEELFWTIGEGDSMEPTIRSGEMILIDSSQKAPRLSEGIWAVAIGDIGMIKRLHIPAKNQLHLLSDNDRIPPIAVDWSDLHVIGRVVAVVRTL